MTALWNLLKRIGVTLQLPLAHGLRIVSPLQSLEIDELLAKPRAQRMNENGIIRQRIHSPRKISWQTPRHGLTGGKTLIKVFLTSFGRLQRAVYPIKPGRQHACDCCIDVAGGVRQTQLKPPVNGADHAGTVVVAIRFPDWCPGGP